MHDKLAATFASYAASFATDAANIIDIDLNQIILLDLLDIKAKRKPQISIATYESVWDKFQLALKRIGCEYWGKLYQEIFENNFEIDKEKLSRRINIPEEIRNRLRELYI